MTSRDLAAIALVILGAVVVLPLGMMWVGGGWGMMGPGMMGPGMMGRWGYGPGTWFGLLTFVVLVAATTLIVLALVRKQPKAEDLEILLKRRLASGEITKAQFEDLKQALQ